MNVTIFDMDWFYKKSSIPNVNCMRLSSYHKQKGDKVNFVSQETHLDLAYDKLYINREFDMTPMPSRKYIDDSRTELLGKGFKYYGAKELNAIVISCRPDYLLYETEARNSYSNANFITFYAGTTLVKTRQDWHNTKLHHKKTIVTDKYFWKAADEEIIWCLEELKQEKNIVFLEPISLRKLLSNKEIQKKFLELHFSTGTKFKWKNDYSSSYPEIDNIITFLVELDKHTKSDLGFIPIRGVMTNHDSQLSFNLDFLRCMQIVAKFKKHKLKCVIIAPKETLSSLWYRVFVGLEIWTRYYFKLSYVEFVLHNICLESGVHWYVVLNNPIKWRNDEIDLLLYFLTSQSWTDYLPLFFHQWGFEALPATKIDFNRIKQNIKLLYKDQTDE